MLVWSNNYFGKEALDCGIRADKIENMLCKINQSVIPHHTNTAVLICDTKPYLPRTRVKLGKITFVT